jgi:holo-[acyl-carrier protein] synthase
MRASASDWRKVICDSRFACNIDVCTMITGIGIDVVQNERIRDSIERFGERFVNRIYTEGEIEYCKNSAHPAIHYAARWAAKEAAFKALGTGWAAGVKWRDVEVVRLSSGKPELHLHGEAQALAKAAGAQRFYVSLTHDILMSCAVVVFET